MTTTAALGTARAIGEAIEAPKARVHLGYREVLTLTGAKPGLEILADRCTLWLTEEGIEADVLLKPGETHTVTCRRRVVLQGIR